MWLRIQVFWDVMLCRWVFWRTGVPSKTSGSTYSTQHHRILDSACYMDDFINTWCWKCHPAVPNSCLSKQVEIEALPVWDSRTNYLFATFLYHALPGHSAKAALHTQWPLPIKYELSVSALKFW